MITGCKSLLVLVGQVGSICFNLHKSSLSVDFSCLKGIGTIEESNCSFPVNSFSFMVILVLEVLVSGI